METRWEFEVEVMVPTESLKRRVRILLASLAIVACLQNFPASLSASELADGMRYYNAGQYIKALAALNRAVSTDKNSGLAHYFRANTLLYVNQREEAMEEYKLAYTFSPAHSQMARYCMAALLADEERQAAEDGRLANRQLIHQMVTQIQAQLALHKQNILQSAQADSSHHARLGDLEERRIQEQADREIEDLANNPIPVVVGRHVHYIPRTEEMNAVREKADREAQHARDRVESRTGQSINEATGRQLELELAASNLESQFLHPNPAGFRLNVLGTNLYVRNYSPVSRSNTAQDENLPVPLVAKAKRLKYIHGKPFGLIEAEPGSSSSGSNVRGRKPGQRDSQGAEPSAHAQDVPGGDSDKQSAPQQVSGGEKTSTGVHAKLIKK